MSDSRDARRAATPPRPPAAPRAASPNAPRAPAVTPRAPAVTPRAPAVTPRLAGSPKPAAVAPSPPAPAVRAKSASSPALRSEPPPPDNGWDDADTVTNIPEPTPRELPAVAAAPPARESSPGSVTTPNASGPALASSMREEVWTIVRAAVDEALAPVLARQKELEARLAQAERERDAAARAPKVASSASAKLASLPPVAQSIPVSFSGAPPAAAPVVIAKAPAVPAIDPPQATAGEQATAPGPARASMPSTGFGVLVSSPPPKPEIDLEAIARGPADVEFDGGTRKRLVGRLVVVVLLLGVLGAIVATIVSRS